MNDNKQKMCALSITRESTIWLKYISIIFVIITHSHWVGVQALENVPCLKDPVFTSIFCEGGMALLLILSGYGISCSVEKNHLKNYWDKRIINVLIPAILIQGAYFIIKTIIRKSIWADGLEIGSFFCLNTRNSLDTTMWYLSMLFFLYFLFWVIYLVFKKIYIAGILILIASLIGFNFFRMNWGNAFYCIICFPLGILYYELSKKIEIIRIPIAIIIILTGYFVFFMICWQNFRKSHLLENIGASAFAISTILLFNLIRIKKCPKILKSSFFLYLLEFKIIIEPRFYTIEAIPKEFIFILLFVVTAIISYILMFMYEHFKVFINKTVLE